MRAEALSVHLDGDVCQDVAAAEAVEVEEVEGGAQSVAQGGQARRLQVLQLAHEGGVVLLPAGLETHGGTGGGRLTV